MNENNKNQKEWELKSILDQIWQLVADIREEQGSVINKEDEIKLLKIEDSICVALNLPSRG